MKKKRKVKNRKKLSQSKSPALPQPAAKCGLRGLLAGITLIVITVSLYWPVTQFDFVNYDDIQYISENPHLVSGLNLDSIHLAFTTNFASNWHPLTWISHMIDVELFGLNPGPHHFVNVVFHVLSTLLLFFVLFQTTRAFGASFFVAGFFAIHPVHVESVAWISERKDVLSTFFLFLTLCFYRRYALFSGKGAYLGLIISYGLGLIAKPMLVTLPVLLLLMDYWPLERFQKRDDTSVRQLNVFASIKKIMRAPLFYEKIPLFILAGIVSVITFVVQQQTGAVKTLQEFPLGLRVANALNSYVIYGLKMLWPSRLAVFYPFPDHIPYGQIIGSFFGLSVLTFSAIRWRKKYPPLFVGWLWYCISLGPVLGIIQVGLQARADRYTYIPYIGLFIIGAWLGTELYPKITKNKIILPLTVSLLFGCHMVSARRQIGYWSNSITLFEHALRVTKDNYMAHYSLGLALIKQNELGKAREHFHEAARIQPDYGYVHYDLANSLLQQDRFEEAIVHYRKALQARPDHAQAHLNLGIALAKQGAFTDAQQALKKALGINQQYGEAYYILGNIAVEQRQLDLALQNYYQALRVNPDLKLVHFSLGNVFVRQGRMEEGLSHYIEELRINPDFDELHFNLANVLAGLGKLNDAKKHYQEVVRINPRFPQAFNNLGNISALQGKPDQALRYYSQELQINPDFEITHFNLGNVYARQNRLDEAIKHYTKALEIEPDYGKAHHFLGSILEKQGRISEARQHYQEALRINPDDSAVRKSFERVMKLRTE